MGNNFSPTISTWRVTESTITIGASGVRTDATLVSPAVSLIDSSSAKSTGSYSTADQSQEISESVTSDAAGKVGTVLSNNDGDTVTVRYDGFDTTENINARSVIYDEGSKVVVILAQDGSSVAVPLEMHDPISEYVLLRGLPGTSSASPNINVKARATISKLSNDNAVDWAAVSIYIWGSSAYDVRPGVQLYRNIVNGTYLICPGTVFSDPTSYWIYLKAEKGAYVKFTKVEISVDNGGTWQTIYDGEFTSGNLYPADDYSNDGWHFGDFPSYTGFNAVMVSGGCETQDLPS